MVGALLVPTPGRADTPPPTECDRLAAHPWDPERVAEGVPQDALDQAALAACRDAVAERPESARLAYQLGRVLERLGYLDEALVYLRRAAAADYVQAAYALGLTHYRIASQVRDDAAAVAWWRKAGALGHGPALAALAMAERDGRGTPFEPVAAFVHMREAAKLGFADAQYAVGMACMTGMIAGSEHRPNRRAPCAIGENVIWLGRAADQEHAEARDILFELGRAEQP
ncbi:MAG: tetratricopeptide repeat protein [Alphaproteobacteria bacterium]